jgi:hypothetical protein
MLKLKLGYFTGSFSKLCWKCDRPAGFPHIAILTDTYTNLGSKSKVVLLQATDVTWGGGGVSIAKTIC